MNNAAMDARNPSVGFGLEAFVGPLHDTMAELRSMGHIVWIETLEAWMTTDHATAMEVMRDSHTYTVDDRRFTTERVIGRSMLSTDGVEHARRRRPFADAFRRSPVEEMSASWLVEDARTRIDRLAPVGGADLRSGLAGPAAAGSMIQALGLTGITDVDLLAWYGRISGAVSDISAGLGGDASDEMNALSEMVVGSVPTSPVLGALADLMPMDELVADVAVMLFGGIETGEAMIVNLFWHLLTSGWWERMDDTASTDHAIEESLRMEPAASRVDRYATRDVTVGQSIIRTGDLVIVSLAAANRDPAIFSDPDRFDPTRTTLGRQLAFAQGPHLCLGRHLARIATGAIIDAARASLPSMRPVDPNPEPPSGLVFRKPTRLDVLW